MYNKGTSISEIATDPGQNKGTISREIDRNSSLEYDCYLGNRAQQRAGLRAKNSHNHHRLRNIVLDKNAKENCRRNFGCHY
jgi:IS30 family transposase